MWTDMGREDYERKLRKRQIRKRQRRAIMSTGRYMTLPKFILIQVIILLSTIALTFLTRYTIINQVDYNDFVREGVVQKYEFVGVPNYNQWVKGGIMQPSELDRVNVDNQIRSKHFMVDKESDLGLKLAGFQYDLETLTYDDIFYMDPHINAKVLFVTTFVVYFFVLEVGTIRLLRKEGLLEWYSEIDMSYWD